MKRFFSCLIVLSLVLQVVFADSIYLKNGEILKGKITVEEKDTVTIEGDTYWKNVPRTEIEKIIKDSLEKEIQETNKEKYNREKLEIKTNFGYIWNGENLGVDGGDSGGLFMQSEKGTMRSQLDWFIVKGGIEQLSDFDFLKLIDDREKLENIEKQRETIGATNRRGVAFAIIGLLLMVGSERERDRYWGFGIKTKEKYYDDTMLWGGSILGLVGLGMMRVPYPSHYLEPLESQKRIFEYNKKLKKQYKIGFLPLQDSFFANFIIKF